MQCLVGLHKDYRNVRGNILMIKPLPSLDQVYQIVLQEEKQRSLSSSVSINGNSTAFHSYISGDCFKNGQFQQRITIKGFQDLVLHPILDFNLKLLSSILATTKLYRRFTQTTISKTKGPISMTIVKYQGIQHRGVSNYMATHLDTNCIKEERLQLLLRQKMVKMCSLPRPLL